MSLPADLPSPLPLAAPLRSVELAEMHRRDDCATYGHCLTLAAVEDWPGMSCSCCDAYDRSTPSSIQVPVGGLVVPPRTTALGRALEHIHGAGRGGCTDYDLAEGISITVDRARLLRAELHDLGYAEPVFSPQVGLRWRLSRRRPIDLVYGRMALEDRCDPVVAQPGPGGRLELVLGRLQVAAAELLGWETIPVVVLAVPQCPICGAYLQPTIDARGVRRRDGYCPGCEGYLWGTPRGIESVRYGPRRQRTLELCPYCGRLPSYQRGACVDCRSLLPRLRRAGVPDRRSRGALLAVRSGLSPAGIASAVGLAYQVAVRVVELLDEPREQLSLFDDERGAA